MSEQPANWATALDAVIAKAEADAKARDEYSDAEVSRPQVLRTGESGAAFAWGQGMLPLQSGYGGFGPERYPTPAVVTTGGGKPPGGKEDKDPKVPEQPATASVAPGSEDIKRLSMPGLDEAISKEIERLTLELINDTKEVLNTGINYKSIDFLPSKEVYASRPKPVSTIKYEFTKMVTKFENNLTNLKNNDYVNYLNLFSVVYNDSGAAELTFNMEIPEYYSSEIELGQVKIVNRGGVK